jgi:hypothetical protein
VIVFTAKDSCDNDASSEEGVTSRRRLLGFTDGPSSGANDAQVDNLVFCNFDFEWYDRLEQRCYRYVWITPNILSGLVIGLVMLISLGIGLCCINDVQTPTVFMSKDDPGPMKGKEF